MSQSKVLLVSRVVLYQAVNGTSITGSVTITPADVFTTYASFTTMVTNLWEEYRVTTIKTRFIPTNGSYQASVFIPSLFYVFFRGAVAPATTVAGITARAESKKVRYGTSVISCTWKAPKDDPENYLFYATTAALPTTGGLVAAWNSGPVTATITYLTLEIDYMVEVRGPKF